jgi:hypothetical protein
MIHSVANVARIQDQWSPRQSSHPMTVPHTLCPCVGICGFYSLLSVAWR